MMTVNIKNVEYPVLFSLRVSMKAAKEFGTIDEALGGKTDEDIIYRRAWLLHEFMLAGKTYAKYENGEDTPEVPSLDELLDCIPFDDMAWLLNTVSEIITNDQKTSIEVAPSKNAGATPVQ